MANKPRKAATPSPTSLGQLPPDLLTRILAWLPLCALGRTAQTSRRFKILCYSDPIYIPKLRALGVTFLDPAADDIGAAQDQKGQLDLSKLAQKLKQLPGGSLLNTNAKYLETGSLFDSDTVAAGGSNNSVSDGPRSVVPNISLDGVPHDVASQSTPSTTTSSASTSGPVMTDVEADAFPCDAPIQVDSTAETAKSPDTQKISATLPQMKKSNIVVGAGGIKSHSPLGKTNSSMSIGTRSKSPSVSRGGGGTAIANTQFFTNINGLRPRDAFKHIITVLAPYYLDFRNHAKDSKVFRDYKDMVAVAQLLNLIVRLSKTGLISDCDDVNLALETTVEWYESMLLGQFERAYDAKHVAEMKRNAVACMELNGGKNCVLLFCAKNPIFFDATFNPSLVASKLPNAITSSAEARGYALADDFARFMDHTLTSCTTQAILVSQVFPPSMDAMTTFVSKVFDDSISEYLVAVLRAARDGEGVAIYLHTLATAVHCCSQFLDLVSAVDVAGARVVVRTRPVKDAMARLFASDWNSYANVEMEHLGRVIDNELRKWNTRVLVPALQNDNPQNAGNVFSDALSEMKNINGTSQTMRPKKVAMSMNRWKCSASANQKNHMKWSPTDRTATVLLIQDPHQGIEEMTSNRYPDSYPRKSIV
ncbi:F-box protein: endocytic membrane traffic, recycling ReCYcling 1 [Entophlyctis sp. JEL0112]|nr:F-box protein: endocytic membrane traffic, recycling ReCYcling 1 [Entophlyctis sp. JEL0112]